MWEEIVASNTKRFELGAISSKEMSDDISTYLNHAERFYTTIRDALVGLSEFCLLVGKDELFHQSLAG